MVVHHLPTGANHSVTALEGLGKLKRIGQVLANVLILLLEQINRGLTLILV